MIPQCMSDSLFVYNNIALIPLLPFFFLNEKQITFFFLQVSDLYMTPYLLAKHMLRQSEIAFISDIEPHTLWPSTLLRNNTWSIFHFCKENKESVHFPEMKNGPGIIYNICQNSDQASTSSSFGARIVLALFSQLLCVHM